MLGSCKFAVSWLYREGERTIRRTLYNTTSAPCIEAARIINGNPYTSEVEVAEVDTGRKLVWEAPIGRVLVAQADEFWGGR